MAGLFDIFDSGSGRQAAQQSRNATVGGINSGLDFYKRQSGRADDALRSGQTNAVNALNQSGSYFKKALPQYRNMYDTGSEGVDYYGQLVGLGGDMEGAKEALAGVPGYQFAQEQGLDALNRRANSRGMLASGNNTQDILKFSQGLADQNYFNYLNALNPYFGQQQAGANGLANTYGNLAGNQADIANVYTNTAANLANNAKSLGSVGYGARTGIGQANSQLSADQYNADQAASQNLWGAILGLGSAATGAAGQAGGFGNLFNFG